MAALHEIDALPVTALPLIVDLDRTLLKIDTLVEQVLSLLFGSPRAVLDAALALRQGKAAFKRAVTDAASFDVENLTVNPRFIAYLEEQHAAGRPLHLVTAADQRIADAVAAKIGLFRSATGTSANHNLRGANKRDYLLAAFPDGFAYAGDSQADVPIWAVAKAAVLVGVSMQTRRSVEALACPVEAEFDGRDTSIRQWLRLLRLHQWSKNLLLFVPLVLTHRFSPLEDLLPAVLVFVAMGLLASGTYVINDILDVASDRRHQSKRRRPIASGDIDAGIAFLLALVLIAAGLGMGMATSLPVGGLLAVYLATTLVYSVALKRMAIVDIFVLASLYTLRVLTGIVLIGVYASYWLLMFSFFLFFSLSLAKRHVEIVQAGRRAGPDAMIAGRGYRTGDTPLTLAMGIASQMIAVLVFSLYLVNDVYPEATYVHAERLWGVVAMVLIWTSRIWLLSHRGELDDDPVSFALRDPPSLLIAALAALCFIGSVL